MNEGKRRWHYKTHTVKVRLRRYSALVLNAKIKFTAATAGPCYVRVKFKVNLN
jgi:hypothetical protein